MKEAETSATMGEQTKNQVIQRDELTGLYNQSAFFHEARWLLDKDSKNKYVFIHFDIDRFRMINSCYGAGEGKRLLKYMAELIQTSLKGYSNCVCGRIYADVFAMCVPVEIGNELFFTKNITNELAAYKKPYYVKLSVGFYEVEDSAMEVRQMYDNATLAALTCKGSFYKTFAYYKREMDEKVKQEHAITSQMKEAIANHEFQVYYQPKYDLNRNSPCGAEALVRWQTATGDLIEPKQFIPVFEKNGFIIEMDYYVWEEVCRFIKEHKSQGKKVLPISVNVSRLNLYDPSFLQRIEDLIHRYQIPMELFQLEITESVFMESESIVMDTILELHRMGFTIMMDDFGSGYSSLNILKDISIDVLKIDMRFLTHTNVNRGQIILDSVVDMAKKLKLQVIVEGVETNVQLDRIKRMGVNFLQGYLYARPMSKSDYIQFTEENVGIKIFEKPQEEIINIHEDYYQSFFTTTLIGLPYGVVLSNKYNEIFQYNQKLTEMLGCGNSLLQVKQFLESNHFLEMLSENMGARGDNKIPFIADVNGESKFYVVSSVKITDLHGNYWGNVCYFIDESIGMMFGTEKYYKKMFLSFVQLYHHVFELDYLREEIREVYCDVEQGHHHFGKTEDYAPMARGIPTLLEWIHPGDRNQFYQFVSENNIENAFIIQKNIALNVIFELKKREILTYGVVCPFI